MKRFFRGGIHPADKKELTSDWKHIPVIKPEQVVIPLSQHIGSPCKPLVEVGDRVYKGQKIGDYNGLCAPVHASVSGMVVAIEERPHSGGEMTQTIIIQNDLKDMWYEGVKPHKNPQNLTAEELFKIIREAGIVGMGGAAFPTHVKASSGLDKIDTLIINACECEPYITADDALIRTEPENILRGIDLLANALKPNDVIVAMEDNKPQAAAILKEHMKNYRQISLNILPTRYPQGAEKQLIRAVTGREVSPGQLPASVSCAVFNISTAAAIYHAVYEGVPLVQRIVSVTGEGISNPQNFYVPIGTPFSALIEAAGGLTNQAVKVIAGGPMMGKAVNTLEVPVIKGTGSVLCLNKCEEVKHPECIRCGKCLEVCPMNLQPLYLYRYKNAGNLTMLGKLHLMDCMECGCCSYICPGKLPLVENFRAGKCALKETKS